MLEAKEIKQILDKHFPCPHHPGHVCICEAKNRMVAYEIWKLCLGVDSENK